MEQCLYDVWLIQLGLGHVVGSCLSAPVISIWSCPPSQDRSRQQPLGYITDPWLRHAGRSWQFPDLAIPCLESMFAAALLGCATTDLTQNGCDTNAAGVSPIITAFLAKVPGGHTTLMQPFRRRSPVSKVGSTTNIPFMRQDEKFGKGRTPRSCQAS